MPALCYLFARNLQVLMMKEGLVPTPIGLISSEWGGTPIQSWTPNREALKRLIMISKQDFKIIKSSISKNIQINGYFEGSHNIIM